MISLEQRFLPLIGTLSSTRVKKRRPKGEGRNAYWRRLFINVKAFGRERKNPHVKENFYLSMRKVKTEGSDAEQEREGREGKLSEFQSRLERTQIGYFVVIPRDQCGPSRLRDFKLRLGGKIDCRDGSRFDRHSEHFFCLLSLFMFVPPTFDCWHLSDDVRNLIASKSIRRQQTFN